MKPPFNCDHQNRLAINRAISDLEKGVDSITVANWLKEFVTELDSAKADHDAMTLEQWQDKEHLTKHYSQNSAE